MKKISKRIVVIVLLLIILISYVTFSFLQYNKLTKNIKELKTTQENSRREVFNLQKELTAIKAEDQYV
ncbi:MAG TPA: hypothetical protein VK338_04275, partial [Candidatus Nitrosocosmicus sp.]|nr:hypothetical protein [Candidatus Nitrosocosmicus sp.]